MQDWKLLTDIGLSRMGIKHRTEPNEKQRVLMQLLAENSGLQIVQDRRYVAAIMMAEHRNFCNFTGSFTPTGYKIDVFGIDTVVMNADANNNDWYRILFHELIHATGTGGRLNRRSALSWTKVGNIEEELVADLGSLKLMRWFGIHEACPEIELRIVNYEVRLTLLQGHHDETKVREQVDAAVSMVLSWTEGDPAELLKAA